MLKLKSKYIYNILAVEMQGKRNGRNNIGKHQIFGAKCEKCEKILDIYIKCGILISKIEVIFRKLIDFVEIVSEVKLAPCWSCQSWTPFIKLPNKQIVIRL